MFATLGFFALVAWSRLRVRGRQAAAGEQLKAASEFNAKILEKMDRRPNSGPSSRPTAAGAS